MFRAKTLTLVVLLLALIVTAARGSPFVAPAPVYGLNAANTNVSPYVGVVAEPMVRWQIPHSHGLIDNPAIIIDARGILFAQSLAPVDASTGQPVGINIPSWRDSTPAIDDANNIYQWVNGRLHAYDPQGVPRWSGPPTNFSDGHGVKIGPDGTVYAGGGDYQLYAFSPQGQHLWTRPGFQITNPPPAIDAEGNLYLVSGYATGRYVSYDRNGNQRWTTPWNESWNFAPPILGPDGNLYVSEDYGTSVYVLNTENGAVIRQQDNLYGGIQAISVSGTLYSCSYQTVRATDLLGNIRWESHIPPSMFLQDLVVDAAGKVYCTTESNQLFAFSATGQQLWMLQLPTSHWQTLPPVIGSDGTVYVQNGDLLLAISGVVPEPNLLAIAATCLISFVRPPRAHPREAMKGIGG